MDGVIHVASPLGNGTETTEALRDVAENATLRVLKEARNTGISKIVMTSSQAASTPSIEVGDVVLDEEFWTSEDNPQLDPYSRSKLASERAAWAFLKNQGLL